MRTGHRDSVPGANDPTGGYDDGRIVCGPDGLDIHAYYVPFGTKRVAFSQVQGLQRFDMTGVWSGRWRLWGTGNPRYWANLDLRRPRKKFGFVVDVGRRISPILTPDRPEEFERVLRAHVDLGSRPTRPLKGPYV